MKSRVAVVFMGQNLLDLDPEERSTVIFLAFSISLEILECQ
jgi:Fe-S cluster assembly ATPase SufC